MRFVIFGLSISSSWGNGHATLWRGLVRALVARGAEVDFFERDTPYYAANRDLHELEGATLVLYSNWADVAATAKARVAEADVAIVTSYCPDAIAAGELARAGRPLSVFYDLDSPVTLGRLRRGETVDYVGPSGYEIYDLVLSYAGGATLEALRRELGSRRVAPLYGHFDPQTFAPGAANPAYRGDLSYIGSYARDRQAKLDALFLEPARRRPDQRFVLAGAQYPSDFAWTDNIYFVRHLPPPDHPGFYASSRLTLNVTRADMAEAGWAPSGRLFEAAGCGACLLSDSWPGLEAFFTPGEEILLAGTAADTLSALELSDAERQRMARAARERALAEHTSAHRADELIRLVSCLQPSQ